MRIAATLGAAQAAHDALSRAGAPAQGRGRPAGQDRAGSATTEGTPPRRGAFITLEGGEGVGKSTQVRHIVARLAAAGIKAIATREPGGSPTAERLRELLLGGAAKSLGPKAEALLFSAARIDHIDTVIAPALAAQRCEANAREHRAEQSTHHQHAARRRLRADIQDRRQDPEQPGPAERETEKEPGAGPCRDDRTHATLNRSAGKP